jgi:cytochrome c oxidase subunit 2
MLNTIFIVTIVLIIAVVIAIFRVSTLVGIVQGESKKQVPSGNKVQAILLLLFLLVGLVAFFYYSFFGGVTKFVLPVASEHGVVVDKLFWITMAIIVFVFVLTHIFLFVFAYKYQYNTDRKADFFPHNNKLEVIWTVIPAIVLAILIFSGLKAWNKVTGPAPEGAEVIEVMGYQYAWAFRYGGTDDKIGEYDFRKIDVTNQMGIDFDDQDNFDDFMAGQLVLPKGRAVELKIRARDVIHSVFNPHFRMQMNAVPGHPTRFWFVPTKSTDEMKAETGNPDFEYELVCNKICGRNHYGMKAIIRVLEQEDYDKWYAEQSAWLKSNPEYLDVVPDNLKEAAKIAAQIEDVEEPLVTEVAMASETVSE